jgi:type VI secretion system secreted protein Hcp
MSEASLSSTLRSRTLTVILGGLVLTGVGAVARAAMGATPGDDLRSPPTAEVAAATEPDSQAMGSITFDDGSSFEIKNFSLGVENETAIGSATGGAGAGKIKFNEFTIKKTSDQASPAFFQNCAEGAHYKQVTITMRKSGGDQSALDESFVSFSFETVVTAKINWSGGGDEGPEESITFVYGKLGVKAAGPDGEVQSSDMFGPALR